MKTGDRVRWTSGAGGYRMKEKTGTIIEVVPAGKYPWISVAGAGPGKCSTRDHESYVVRVAGNKHRTRYWPRVAALARIDAALKQDWKPSTNCRVHCLECGLMVRAKHKLWCGIDCKTNWNRTAKRSFHYD